MRGLVSLSYLRLKAAGLTVVVNRLGDNVVSDDVTMGQVFGYDGGSVVFISYVRCIRFD